MSLRISSVALCLSLATSVAFAQSSPSSPASPPGTQGTGGSPGVPANAPGAMLPGGAPHVADADFVRMASAAGMAEVALGQLGADKGTSDQVKQFGQQMVTDHTKANTQLTELAKQKGAAVSAEPTPADRAAAAKIGNLTGADFDKAFSERMVMDHKKAVALFKKESQSGKDPDLKAFATQTLPVLEQHLEMAKQLPNGSTGGMKH